MKSDRTMWLAGLGVGALAVGGIIYVLASKKEEAKPSSGGGGTQPPPSTPDRVPPAGVELWNAQSAPFTLQPGKQYRLSAPQMAPQSPELLALNGLLSTLPGVQSVTVLPADWPQDDATSNNVRYQVTFPSTSAPQQVLLLPPGVKVWVKS